MIELLVLATGLATVLIFVIRILSFPKFVKEYGLNSRFIADALTRTHIKNTIYRAFKFDQNRFPTEHSGDVLYYVEPERLFDENYHDLDALCNLVAREIRKLDFDCLVGVPLSGSHLGVLVAYKLKKPFAAFGFEIPIKRIPKQPSEIVVGYNLNCNQKALVFDDTSVSGVGIAEVAINLRKLNVEVEDAYAIVDKEEGAKENLADINIRLHSLISASTLIDILRQQGKISAQEYMMIMEDMETRRKKNIEEFKRKLEAFALKSSLS